MVLMKVDLPAPLSPSRQWHSPGNTDSETPASAMTEPKCFSMSMSSISGVSAISALPRDQAADIGVENDGEQQDDAKENAEKRAFHASEEQALLDDAEDQRTERGTDDRAVAAGQQRAANDHRDDGLEFLQKAAVGRRRAELHHLASGEDRGAEGRQHEHEDLHPVDRHADIARRLRITAGSKDPVSELGFGEQNVPEDDEGEGPDHQHRNPVYHGLAGSDAAGIGLDDACLAQPGEQALENLAAEERGEPVAFRSLPHPADDGLPRGGDGKIDGKAAQDIERGKRDDEGGKPGRNDDVAVKGADRQGDGEGH